MTAILLIVFCLILLLFFFGYGPALFLIPEYLKNYRFYLIPLIGYAFALTVLENIGILLPMRIAIWILVAFCLCLTVAALLRRRKNQAPVESKRLERPSHWKLITLYVFSLGVGLLPILYMGFPTSFAVTNNDGYWYITLSKWLISHAYANAPIVNQGSPWLTSVQYPVTHFVRGVNLLPAGIDSLLRIDPYVSMSIFSAILISFVPLVFFLVCRLCFSLSDRNALIAAVLVAVNSSILRTHFEANFHQVSGFIFLPLALGFFYYAHENPKWREVAIAGLFISSLVNSYYEFLPFFVLPVAAFVIYGLLFGKHKKQVLIVTAVIAALAIVLNVYATKSAVLMLLSWTDLRSAGIIPFMGITQNLAVLFGIANLYDLQDLYYRSMIFAVTLKLTLLAAASALLVGLRRSVASLRVFLGIGLALYAIPLSYMILQKYSYGVFKGLQAMTVTIDIIMAIGFSLFLVSSNASTRLKTTGAIVSLGALTLVLGVSSVSTAAIVKKATPPALVIGREFPKMADFVRTTPKTTVFALEGNDSQYSLINFEHYSVYFINSMAGREVSFRSNKVGYFFVSGQPADYFLKQHYDYVVVSTKPITRPWRSYEKDLNGILIYKRIKGVDMTTFGEDWRGGGEKNGQPVKWLNSGASISAETDTEQTRRLSLKAFSALPARRISIDVSINGREIGALDVGRDVRELTTEPFILKKGLNVIDIKVKMKGPAIPKSDIAVGVMDVRIPD